MPRPVSSHAVTRTQPMVQSFESQPRTTNRQCILETDGQAVKTLRNSATSLPKLNHQGTLCRWRSAHRVDGSNTKTDAPETLWSREPPWSRSRTQFEPTSRSTPSHNERHHEQPQIPWRTSTWPRRGGRVDCRRVRRRSRDARPRLAPRGSRTTLSRSPSPRTPTSSPSDLPREIRTRWKSTSATTARRSELQPQHVQPHQRVPAQRRRPASASIRSTGRSPTRP